MKQSNISTLKIEMIVIVLFLGVMTLKSEERYNSVSTAIQYDQQGKFKDSWESMNKCQPDDLSDDELMLMAMYCKEGRKGIKKNLQQMRELFRFLNKRLQVDKSKKALYYRGICMMYGELNLKEAYELIKKSADEGYSDAQTQLAIMLLKGIGIEPDQSLAMDYLNKAVANNNLTAKAYLASYCLGQKKDLSKGLALAQEASNAGNRAGQYTLAMAYEKGVGIDKNDKKALRLYQLAADQGLQDAKERLAWLKESLNISQEQYIADEYSNEPDVNK